MPFYRNETAYSPSYLMHCRTRYRKSWSQVFVEANTSILATSETNCWIDDAGKKHNSEQTRSITGNQLGITDITAICLYPAPSRLRNAFGYHARYDRMHIPWEPRVLLEEPEFQNINKYPSTLSIHGISQGPKINCIVRK